MTTAIITLAVTTASIVQGVLAKRSTAPGIGSRSAPGHAAQKPVKLLSILRQHAAHQPERDHSWRCAAE